MREKEVKKLYDSISSVRDQFIEEAQSAVGESVGADAHLNRHSDWIKRGILAACLCFVAVGAIIVSRKIHMGTNDPMVIREGGAGTDEGDYSVAVYPPTESMENVASADVKSLKEDEAWKNSLAEHLPWQLPNGFHYGYGSIYCTVMKSGKQYNMLRVEYISGEISEWKFVDDDGAAAVDVDPDSVGETFVVCVMNYQPKDRNEIFSSKEEVTKTVLEEKGYAYIRFENCYIGVFVNTADSEVVLNALKYME